MANGESNVRLTDRMDKLEARVRDVEMNDKVIERVSNDVGELKETVQDVRHKLAQWSIPMGIMLLIVTAASTAAILGFDLGTML